MARRGSTDDRDARPQWALYLEDRMGVRLWGDKARRWEAAPECGGGQEWDHRAGSGDNLRRRRRPDSDGRGWGYHTGGGDAQHERG